ncbi:hypothetical protein [Methylobacterium frigidaeris]|uniref:Uncharacterized protein n=1 Tax=Methylobacterium frigidaeris TaxID=2038277 RepID=A0AA37HG76_9HYPH|nr:hypothetical protein [Methylobacterium frigidaeris]PIK73831.1 hypothetical protein CS379_06115 [Methylobacterium frigidaeris]GJD65283.1 hypothetical protein MPEAHAMD_5471 [Methylobacterium frigidaeris]
MRLLAGLAVLLLTALPAAAGLVPGGIRRVPGIPVEWVFFKGAGLAVSEPLAGGLDYSATRDPRAGPGNRLIVAGAFARAHPGLVARVVGASVCAAAWASEEANREAVFGPWVRSGAPAAVVRADDDGRPPAERLSPRADDLPVESCREKAARA